MHFYFITFTGFNFYILVQVSFTLQLNGLTGVSFVPRDFESDTILPVFVEMPIVGFFFRSIPFLEISVL